VPVEFSTERYAACGREVAELAALHDAEIPGEFPYDPDLESYRKLDEVGALVIFVAREAGVLVGYVLTIVMPHLQYRVRWGSGMIFIRKDYRKPRVADRLLAFSEDSLRARGVLLVTIGVHPAHPALGELLVHRDYSLAGSYFSRRL
jgi:GNAT superfamily N-acetyltransferase